MLYLTIAGILNVLLNLFFVIVCGMAAEGVALASVISQYVSAILVLGHMARLSGSCRLEKRALRLHREEIGRILGLGIPSGVQNAVFAIANLFIQVGVNSFDSVVVSGNAAAVNVDNVIYNVMAAIPPIYEPLPSATIVTSTIRLRIIDLFVAYLISP